MADLDLEDALEELYQIGTVESTGSFTLSAEKAREKISESLFANPASFILCLYSTGYMAGAKSFNIDVGVRRSTLRFEGASLEKADLDDIFAHLLGAPESPREWALQELALGLHTAPAAGVQEIRLRTPSLVFRIRDGRTDLTAATGSGFDGLEMDIEHRRSLWSSVRSLFSRHRLPEVQVLRAALCPVSKAGTLTSWPQEMTWPREMPRRQSWLESEIEGGESGARFLGRLGFERGF